MDLSKLPDVIIRNIFLYLQNPEAKLIKDKINIYEIDHNSILVSQYNQYYIKHIYSFSEYYFHYLHEPYEYDSYLSAISNYIDNYLLSI